MKITQQTVSIDGIDKIIIRHLLEDARTPIQILANVSGISGAAVHQRLKKMEKAKVIKGSQIILNPKILGWFVGQVMKESKGKANPKLTNQLIAKKLK